MTLLEESARNILIQALVSDIGIVVLVEPTADMVTPALRAKQVLYRFKNEDADFANLQIYLSPDDPDKRLWIIKRQSSEGQS